MFAAALKCRQRKKAWLASLQAQNEYLKNENERLTSVLVANREEISRLSALVGSAGIQGVAGGTASINGHGQPVSMNVNLALGKGAAGTGGAAASTGAAAGRSGATGRGGYGY
jgi:ATF/CREB family transcription factor